MLYCTWIIAGHVWKNVTTATDPFYFSHQVPAGLQISSEGPLIIRPHIDDAAAVLKAK